MSAQTVAPPVIQPGFADPVHDAQACFRAVLEAMALPCRTVSMPAVPPTAYLNTTLPSALLAGLVGVALALCDADTPVWLDESLDTPAMRRHLRFHCGCPLVTDAKDAAFVFIGNARSMPRLGRFSAGTAEYPDRSATLVIGVLWDKAGMLCSASGPGVSPQLHPAGLLFSPAGLPFWFWNDWADNHAAYPLGVDVVFIGANPVREGEALVAGLPRTTTVIPMEGVKEKSACMLR